jgi:hypothetical protein
MKNEQQVVFQNFGHVFLAKEKLFFLTSPVYACFLYFFYWGMAIKISLVGGQ